MRSGLVDSLENALGSEDPCPNESRITTSVTSSEPGFMQARGLFTMPQTWWPLHKSHEHIGRTCERPCLPCCNGDDPPRTTGKGYDGPLPPIHNAWWERLVFHSVVQDLLRECGGGDRDRMSSMMKADFSETLMNIPAVK